MSENYITEPTVNTTETTTDETCLYRPELVFFDFDADNYIDFFKKLSDILLEKGYVKESWLQAITDRERNFPTGLMFETIGVAIPHVDPQHIVKPYIAIIKPKKSVSFEPMAGMVDHAIDTNLVVNLGLLKHAEDQVEVLQAMMGMFMNEDAVNDVQSQTTPEGMVECFKRYANVK